MNQSIGRLYFSRRLIKSYIHDHDFVIKNAENIDLQHANINKLLPIVEWHLRRFSRTKELNSRNIEMIFHYNRHQAYKQRVVEEYFHAFVVDKLKKKGIRWALRKGMSYTKYYKEISHRTYNDIDLLISEYDQIKFEDAMLESGFECGIYDSEKGKVIKHNREDILYYKMSPDHLPHYTKILEDGTDIRLDAAFTLAWNNYDNKERLAEVLNLEQKKNGGKHIMTAGGHYLECAFHLYREMFSGSSKKSKTFRASGLLDLALIRKNIDYHYYDSLFQEVNIVSRILNDFLDIDIPDDQLLNKNYGDILNKVKTKTIWYFASYNNI
ncbi:hypothetical protein C6H65_11290 [Photorhabdus luminescens]|nr:hypothetical protein C6H65_11290 [Photorhabdus luminescens]